MAESLKRGLSLVVGHSEEVEEAHHHIVNVEVEVAAVVMIEEVAEAAAMTEVAEEETVASEAVGNVEAEFTDCR